MFLNKLFPLSSFFEEENVSNFAAHEASCLLRSLGFLIV